MSKRLLALCAAIALSPACGNPGNAGEEAIAPAPRLELRESDSARVLVHALQSQFGASLRGASISALEVDGTLLIPKLAAGGRPAALQVRIAANSGDWTLVEDRSSTVAAAFRLDGASGRAPATLGGGRVVYERAAPDGGAILLQASSTTLEDYVVFDRAPARGEVSYSLRIDSAAGLRLVSNTLELMDASGTPRLRVAPPFLFDTRGTRTPASLEVEGCVVDRNPVAPWGREPLDPGNSECTLRVSWKAGDVTYPALLDPAWSVTSKMIAPRLGHGATRMLDGRVIIAGSYSPLPAGIPVEIFDPATETWSVTSPCEPRAFPSLMTLDDGRILALGGSQPGYEAEVYDPATADWHYIPQTPQFSIGMAPLRLANGDILVAGGCYELANSCGTITMAALLHQTTETWEALPPLPYPVDSDPPSHGNHTASLLPDGRALLAGGLWLGNPASSRVTLFDPATQQWSAGPPLHEGRGLHQATTLPDGRIVVVGGYASYPLGDPGPPVSVGSGEIFDPATQEWTLFAAHPRAWFQMVQRSDSTILLVGGEAPAETPDAEILLGPTFTGYPLEMPGGTRIGPTTTVLSDGRTLVAGGLNELSKQNPPTDPSSILLGAEPFDPDAGASGAGAGGASGAAGFGGAGGLTCGAGTVRNGNTCVSSSHDDDGGCGCRTMQGRSPVAPLVLAAIALLGFTLRTRRRST